MSWVYILKCRDGSYYVGSTGDMEKRLAEHQQGTYCGYTFLRRPVKLVFCQQCARAEEAIALERRLKGWSPKKKEALIEGRYDLLPELSRSRQRPR